MELNDKIWSKLEGGYRIPYDASRPLKKLQQAGDRKYNDEILDELWDNLHHQGDVGLASYLAVPQLVAICIDKRSFDFKFIALVVLIENCRINGGNPELPMEYDSLYFGSLSKFEQYLLANFKNISDRQSMQSTLALFATLNGLPDLGKIIEYLDKEATEEFFEEHFS
jgi:hypothetical protein